MAQHMVPGMFQISLDEKSTVADTQLHSLLVICEYERLQAHGSHYKQERRCIRLQVQYDRVG